METGSFDQVYRAYFDPVYRYVLSLSGDPHTAEEITQEAFFRAFSKSASFRNESDEMTWLCAIAKNCFVDETRRKSKTAPIPEELPASGKSIEQQITDKDSSFRIHAALHTMDEPYREVFEPRVFGELSFSQIGTIFGKTENWARVTYHRARLKLQERMDEHEN